MLAFNAVEVAIEETRVAIEAEEDESVSQRLEESLDRSFESLVRLSVVIHDQSLSNRVSLT